MGWPAHDTDPIARCTRFHPLLPLVPPAEQASLCPLLTTSGTSRSTRTKSERRGSGGRSVRRRRVERRVHDRSALNMGARCSLRSARRPAGRPGAPRAPPGAPPTADPAAGLAAHPAAHTHTQRSARCRASAPPPPPSPSTDPSRPPRSDTHRRTSPAPLLCARNRRRGGRPREKSPIGIEVRLTTPEPDPDQRRCASLTISTAPSTSRPFTACMPQFDGMHRRSVNSGVEAEHPGQGRRRDLREIGPRDR